MKNIKHTALWAVLFLLPVIATAIAGVPVSLPTAHDIGLASSLIIGATLSANVVTLLDLAKSLDPNGMVAKVVNLLSQKNPILQDMHYEPGNLPTGHRTTILTGLPDVYWRLINQGTPPSKSTRAQVDETTAMLESWINIDEELVNLAGNKQAFRLQESQAHYEALAQEMASTLFYGNSATAQEEFTGLAPRYSSLSAGNAQNIVNGGGSGSDNTSIWLIKWGQGVHGIVPQGSTAGVKHEDLGVQTVTMTAGIAGSLMRAYQDHFIWKNGLVVRDWRDAVRIANIDVSNLVAQSSAAVLKTLMTKAIYRLVNGKEGAVFYMNRTVAEFLDIQTTDQLSTGGGLTTKNVQGEEVLHFRGVPIRVTDALLETEATVS